MQKLHFFYFGMLSLTTIVPLVVLLCLRLHYPAAAVAVPLDRARVVRQLQAAMMNVTVRFDLYGQNLPNCSLGLTHNTTFVQVDYRLAHRNGSVVLDLTPWSLLKNVQGVVKFGMN